MTNEQSTTAWIQRVIVGVVCILVAGIYVWNAEPGILETANPRAQDAYYNLLVQGFQAGQLNVKRDAPPGLAGLANPYDPAINAQYVWDSQHLSYEMSYYKGKLYLYFGVTPAVVLFWPYAALTGHYLPTTAAVVIFFVCGFLVGAGLLHAIWQRYFPKISVWVLVSGIIAFGLCIDALETLSSCDIYGVARSCGFMFTMLSLAAIWLSLHYPKHQFKWLLLASLAYGLAVGSRPSLLFGAIILLVPVVRAWREATERSSRWRAGLLFLAISVPITLIGIGLMFYNYFRFDNPFEFGWHYQLTSFLNNNARQFSLHYLWFNFLFYFVEPMRWSSYFPFLQALPLPAQPPGFNGVGEPYAGMLIDYPIVWLALATPLAWRNGPGRESLYWFAAAVFLFFLTSVVTLSLFFAADSGYELDFLPALMLLAATGIFGLERALTVRPVLRRGFRCLWCLLLAYSVLFNVLARIETRATTDWLAGNFFMHRNQTNKAVEYFQKALALEPESAAFYYSLGNAFAQTGRADEAIVQYHKALEIKPDYAEANNNLGFTLIQKGRVNESIPYFLAALKSEQSSQTYYNLGYAYFRSGLAANAVVCYRKAIELQPQFIIAQKSLAWILATWPDASIRNGKEAVTLAEQVNQLTRGQNPDVLRTLAAAYAETGKFPEAIETAKKALALAGAQSNATLMNELQTEIGHYQNGIPWRSTNN